MNIVIERKVDNLGRIVIPVDFRKYYNINEREMVDIRATEDGVLICSKKHKAGLDDTKN